jgi:hypothetical protein
MTDNENPPALLTGSVSTETQLTTDQARRLTDLIKVSVERVWELIERAYVKRAWRALGYDSWDSYVDEEFGTARFRLPREERAEVVTSLRDAGLSLRAISAATGVDKNTVSSDLRKNQLSEIQTVEDGAQASERPLKLIQGRDGRKRRNNRFVRIKAEQKRMKAEAAERKAAKVTATATANIINTLDTFAETLREEIGGMNPTQRREMAAAITRLAEAIGMHYEGITFDDGGFSMVTPPPEGN